jgi:SAM-dependent methyltransferase
MRTEAGYRCNNEKCEHSIEGEEFSVIDETPVLISEKRCDTVCSSNADRIYVNRKLAKYSRIKKILAGESEATKENCKNFVGELLKNSKNPTVLVIGAGEKGFSTDDLWGNEAIEIHGIDIYKSDSVHVICDAHYLPLKSGSYDGVWIQAVLEHVVEPHAVVNEIFRVLRTNGLVYAETPFMQQVHEGAYDFTRFTVLGHRYLFKKFESINIGGIKGPETVFAWAVRYLVWSITRSRGIGRLFGIATGLLMRPLGIFISKKSMHDASSAVYFFGRKSNNNNLSHKDLIRLYEGQFK